MRTMIDQIPVGTPADYMHSWHLLLWIVAALILLLGAILFFKRSAKKGLIESQVQLFRSYGLFALFMTICRAFFMLAYNNVLDSYTLLLHIGFLFGQLALIPPIWMFEKYLVKNTKKVFTIIAISLAIISILGVILQDTVIVDLLSQRIGAPVLAVVYFYLYLYLIKNSTGEMKRKCIYMVVGFSILVVGIIFDSIELVSNPLIPLWMSPALFMAGGLLIVITQR
jgi:hypothetical protein